MNEELKLSLIQMHSNSWDVEENLKKANSYIDQAAEDGANLIVLPEFFNHPYFFFNHDYKYLDYAERFDGITITTMQKKAKEHRVHIVATILEREAVGLHYDTSFVINPEGEIVGKYRKLHPAAVIGLEKVYFRAGYRYPIFEINGWKVGIIICYDLFFPEVARGMTLRGAEVILAPFATPQYDAWESMLRTRSFENGVYFAPCNKVGKEGGRAFAGKSMIVNPMGDIEKLGKTDEEGLISSTLKQSVVSETRRKHPFLRDRRPEVYKILSQSEEDVRGLL